MLERGKRARVTSVEATTTVAQRLMILGLLPGVEVEVVQVAPFGDPIAVEFAGRRLSLRRDEATGVRVCTEAGATKA